MDTKSKKDDHNFYPQRIFIIILFFLVMNVPSGFSDNNIKEPNVSGQFYSADPNELSREVEGYISSATVMPYKKKIDIIMAPHAGYLFSGPVAGYSFKSISEEQYKTIVIVAPSHFFGFDGVSVWDKGGFKTPLGVVPVDEEFTQKLMALNKKFYFEPGAYEQEHSLEVEIPFLQKTFRNFKIVPIIMGQPSFQICQDLADSLHQLIGERNDVLIVISTDMSHYHDYDFAREMDHHTLAVIKELNAEEIWKQCHLKTMEMCGFIPVTTAILYARKIGVNHVDLLRYANSGDVTGDKSRVVGYSSVVFYRNPGNEGRAENSPSQKERVASLTVQQKKRLIEIARKTIATYLQTGKTLVVEETDPRLLETEGAFVTIHKHGELRGCIGRIIGFTPLYLTVRDMAIAAATEDSRFEPVKTEELNDIDLEISVLSKPRVIANVDEIKMGIHGVIVSQEHHGGVFLPQVATETRWSKEKFLTELCVQKAGLPANAWQDPKTKIEVFTAEVFSEKDTK